MGLSFKSAKEVPKDVWRAAVMYRLRRDRGRSHHRICELLGCATIAERSEVAATLETMVSKKRILVSGGGYRRFPKEED